MIKVDRYTTFIAIFKERVNFCDLCNLLSAFFMTLRGKTI